jgi:hypothetical protein
MSIIAKVLLVYLVIALIVFAWMFRYDMQVSNGTMVYVTDRWTGTMYSCYTSACTSQFQFNIRKEK